MRKSSNKRIVILANDQIKMHFLRFLSAAKRYETIMPTVFEKNGTDMIVVTGLISCENQDCIEVSLEVPGAGYLFQ